ncbi:hypothetical protein [Saccharothrix sp.]|uniref:hypothetical protein n=1 Tax=Saccharothrix sp. TaxID=1873460 RepID=UPI002811298B|nr:hypothetical protein [Saccharothrix sp.]
MTEPIVPVLWLCGPPGVGKTTVGWAVYQLLLESGVDAGYVDVDQLGICYPEPPSDPGRHLVQARNLDAVVANSGRQCVVVSGVVDVERGVPVDLIPHAALTLCRLQVDPEEHRRRLVARQAPADMVDRALVEAAVLEPGIGFTVDAGGAVSDVVDRVLRRAEGWLAPERVLWLCGATAVGKSTVGFAVYQRLLRTGRTTAYVDLDQIGLHGEVDHRLRAAILAAMWRNYRATGARTLVLTGPVEPDLTPYTAVLPQITLYRLHATRDRLADRIRSRARGEGWNQPGDPIRDQPTTTLHHLTERAAAEADLLDRLALGHRIDTDHHDPDHLADLITTDFHTR